MRLLLLCALPLSLYHCHWHGGIPAFASSVLLRSRRVTTATHWLYHVPFYHLWNQLHLLFLCGNRKMPPPSRVQLDFDFSLLLLLAGDVSLNPDPRVHV